MNTTSQIVAVWRARKSTGQPCWCGRPNDHVGWPVCADRATTPVPSVIGSEAPRSTAADRPATEATSSPVAVNAAHSSAKRGHHAASNGQPSAAATGDASP